MLIEFPDDRKLGRIANTLLNKNEIQNDIEKLTIFIGNDNKSTQTIVKLCSWETEAKCSDVEWVLAGLAVVPVRRIWNIILLQTDRSGITTAAEE